MFRLMLRGLPGGSTNSIERLRQRIGCRKDDQIDPESVKIVPVNLTYYPIRAGDNFLSDMVSRYMKEPSERMVEELKAEGTMFLEGVDIDVRFGQPLDTAEYIKDDAVKAISGTSAEDIFAHNEDLLAYLRDCSRTMMRIYMERIYTAATVNHDHLLASLLRRRSMAPFDRLDLARKTYLATLGLQEAGADKINLHSALEGNQLHLLSDDRHNRLSGFIDFGLETGCLIEKDGKLKKHESDWLQPADFHLARISNPCEVMANEVEPLAALQKIINRVSRTPDWLDRIAIGRRLYKEDQQLYQRELQAGGPPLFDPKLGRPFLLRSRSRKAGVVLLHSFLSVPAEVRELGTLLQKNGCWVYGVRLPGHGTTPEHLAGHSLSEWRLALERGYVLISSLCSHVFLAGFSASSMLMLEFAAHLSRVDGVAAICPPYKLQDYSRRFMPPTDIWNRLVSRWKGNKSDQEFVEFTPENPEINYTRNPVAGVSQIGGLLDLTRSRLKDVTHPTLIVSADQDQVIGAGSSAQVYEAIGSENKELMRFSSMRHNIITGDHTGIEARVRQAICSFVMSNID
ncbi:MAG: alpha/beta fold hydrolase [Desulfofustis sp.]